jgi:hypothetical protein
MSSALLARLCPGRDGPSSSLLAMECMWLGVTVSPEEVEDVAVAERWVGVKAPVATLVDESVLPALRL